MLENVRQELGETNAQRCRTVAGELAGSSSALTRFPLDEALHEHRAQPVDRLGEVDDVAAVLGQLPP